MDKDRINLSTGSASFIAPFNNYDPKVKTSWLCCLCGPKFVFDEEVPNIQRKQKITLSKGSKNTKNSNIYSNGNQTSQTNFKIERKGSHRISLKSQTELKLPNPVQIENKGEALTKNSSSRNIINLQLSDHSKSGISSHHSQQNIPYQCRYPVNYIQNQVFEQKESQIFIKTLKNNQLERQYHPKSSTNIQTTDSYQNMRPLTFAYEVPAIQPIVQEITHIKQHQNVHPSNHFANNSQKQTFSKSNTLTQSIEQNSINSITYSSKRQKEQKLRDTPQSIKALYKDEPKKMKVKNKKSKSSKTSRLPKFLTNLRRVSSRSENESQSENSSNFTQLGNKIKIGIRKVQSINSQESEDHYSEVLSHGQKSFLMPEIHQEEESSRVSSGSRFSRFSIFSRSKKQENEDPEN